MRVLIADDQKSVGSCLADLVSQCNHEVLEVVTSGLDAIHAYSRLAPDVVLMDYWMPRLNGATACRNILAKNPGARIILVSASIPNKDITDSGAVAVLPKPLELAELYDALYSAGAPTNSPTNNASPNGTAVSRGSDGVEPVGGQAEVAVLSDLRAASV